MNEFGDMTEVSNNLAAQSRTRPVPPPMESTMGPTAEAIPEIPGGMAAPVSPPHVLSEAIRNSCGVGWWLEIELGANRHLFVQSPARVGQRFFLRLFARRRSAAVLPVCRGGDSGTTCFPTAVLLSGRTGKCLSMPSKICLRNATCCRS